MPLRRYSRSLPNGFTLIELLVVLAILAVLVALTAAGIQRVRAAAARTTCLNNLRQMGLALHMYHDQGRSLPPGCSYRQGKDPHPHMSWLTRLLPYLEQEALWKQALEAYRADPFFETPPHQPILGRVMPLFTCPADPTSQEVGDIGTFRAAFTSYLGVSGVDYSTFDGVLYLDSAVRFADIKDGLSNTIAVGERPHSPDKIYGWWYAGWGQRKDGSVDHLLGVRERNVLLGYNDCPRGPYDYAPGQLTNKCDLFHFWSLHSGGANFLFADGTVRFLKYISNDIMPILSTRAGGDTDLTGE